jgi:hypothetical protein
VTVDLGPPVERQVAADMIRRALPFLPALVVIAGLIWGVDGALSAAFAVGIVLANFGIAAAILAWAARISPTAMAVAAFASFFIRFALITVAVLAVKDQAWVELVPLGITLVVTHLGLLIWESRYVSLSLAFPVTPGRS